MAGLAARFSAELNFEEDDVLHQLEDLRSAATSGFVTTSHQQPLRTRRMSEETSSQLLHNYANFPSSNLEDKNYMPGIYAVSFKYTEASKLGVVMFVT